MWTIDKTVIESICFQTETRKFGPSVYSMEEETTRFKTWLVMLARHIQPTRTDDGISLKSRMIGRHDFLGAHCTYLINADLFFLKACLMYSKTRPPLCRSFLVVDV